MPKKRPDPVEQAGDVPSVKLQDRFGRNLRALRNKLGLSQRDMAKASGIAQTDISLIERGQVNLTVGTMERLAKAVDRDAMNLLTEKPDDPTKK